mmetsp:Transcript_55607/g.146717  ORF Transcript_55607/g.146717 Transcript_55607/m.146717 type:complete len:81 (-) Transcript_55607:384-626(-)
MEDSEQAVGSMRQGRDMTVGNGKNLAGSTSQVEGEWQIRYFNVQMMRWNIKESRYGRGVRGVWESTTFCAKKNTVHRRNR